MERIITEPNNILIIGKKGSAKSCLAWSFLENAGKITPKKLYVFRFPKPELLNKLPFKVINITSMKQLYNLTDAFCLIDEAHRYFDVLNKQVNEELKELLANSRQNNNNFIFITHNSYFITRGLFSYIDVRIIKEVNEGHWDMERSHMKKLYSKTNISSPSDFFIDCDYIRGKQRFIQPSWYTLEFSTAYKNEITEEKSFFAKIAEIASKTAKNCDKEKI